MSKPWSKLQRDLYLLLDDTINIQIHCRAYRMPKSISTNPQIPRYWVTLGKGETQEILFDYPKVGKTTSSPTYWSKKEIRDNYLMYEHIPAISDAIRDYINTPLSELLEKQFLGDKFGITDILKAADRRIGKRQFGKLPKTEAVQKVLAARGYSPAYP